MKELTFIYMRWTIQDARTGALLQLQSIPSQHLSSPPFAACAHSIWFPFLLAVRLLPPTMSSQQCLRHLPSALRSSALRAGARSAVRAPSARSYSAITRATSSGLLSQASKYVISLEYVGAQLSGMQTPWTARDTASLDS